jgi:PhzF family phenazine biosynthesis protein
MPLELRFAQIDAFATKPFEGNPAAVLPLDTWLPDATLQAIAAENNLSETAFIVKSGDGLVDYHLRWFTPTVEVEMCGHATLASGHYLLARDDRLDRVRFSTVHVGVLEVGRDGDRYTLSLPAWPVAPHAGSADIAAILGAPGADMYRSTNAAEDVVVALLPSAAAVRALAPDFRALRNVRALVIATAPGDAGHDIVSRVFVSGYGIDEDPVTGAAHAALTPFWAERLGRDRFSAFQASARGGAVDCRRAGDRVILGGSCVTVIEGTFRL